MRVVSAADLSCSSVHQIVGNHIYFDYSLRLSWGLRTFKSLKGVTLCLHQISRTHHDDGGPCQVTIMINLLAVCAVQVPVHACMTCLFCGSLTTGCSVARTAPPEQRVPITVACKQSDCSCQGCNRISLHIDSAPKFVPRRGYSKLCVLTRILHSHHFSRSLNTVWFMSSLNQLSNYGIHHQA